MDSAIHAILEELKENRYAPVYFIEGEEPYYIDLIADYIEENVLQEHEKAFNQIVVYGRDVQMNDVLTHARRFPAMAERQVVIVKEAQEIADLKKKEAENLFLSYLKNPVPTTILLFCHKYKTIDRRKSLGKALKEKAILVTTKKLYENQIPEWITKYLEQRGFRITEKARHMLADAIGNNLQRLSNEIDKMILNFKEPIKLEAQHIELYIGISKEYNVFELQKALGVKDLMKAQQIINYFAANPKDNPIIPTIALLFTFYSKLMLVHCAKNATEPGLAKLLKVHPYFVRDYKVAAGNFSLPKIADNIHHLKMADLRAKGIESASTPEGEILKELVYNLLH